MGNIKKLTALFLSLSYFLLIPAGPLFHEFSHWIHFEKAHAQRACESRRLATHDGELNCEFDSVSSDLLSDSPEQECSFAKLLSFIPSSRDSRLTKSIATSRDFSAQIKADRFFESFVSTQKFSCFYVCGPPV